MPVYSFKLTQEIRTQAQLNLVCENLQEAMAVLAAMSQAGNIQWESGVGMYNHAMVHSICKDGVPIPGVADAGAGPGGWHGALGRFELANVPEELLAIKD